MTVTPIRPIPLFDDEAPTGAQLTPYDKRHFVTYLRLLDADAQGADWQEVVSIIFAVNPASDIHRARRLYSTHLARAQWMTKSGYRHLLDSTNSD